MDTFYIKQNDELPALQITVTLDGVAYDLSAATALTFSMMDQDGVAKIAEVAAAFVTDGTDGKLIYQWVDGDTDEVGTFDGEFELTFAAGQLSIPNREHLTIEIIEELVEEVVP